MSRRSQPTYVAYPMLPGITKCGKCFRGRITKYSQRCKVCKAMNLSFEHALRRGEQQ